MALWCLEIYCSTWEDDYHMADSIPHWIEWERELRNLFKEVSRLEVDMSRY